MKRPILNAAFAAVFAVGLTTGCGGGVEVKGRVGDDLGSQEQGLSTVFPSQATGGEGTVAAATRVQASIVNSEGVLEVVGEAEIRGGGEYTLTVPEGEDVVLIQALSSEGEVEALTLLERTDLSGAIQAAPMDSETSLEALVYLSMRAQGASEANAVDLRGRITRAMATEVQKGQDDAGKSQERIEALAKAIHAAQEAEVQAWAKAGVQLSQAEMFALEAEAGLGLSAALAKGESAAEAHAAFFEATRAKLEEKGLEAKEQAEAEREASASFRIVVKAELDAEGTADPLIDLAAVSAASAEARASGAALAAVLAAAEASEAAKEAGLAAAATLKTEVAAATTSAAAAEAFARFSATVATNADLSTTVLGKTVGAGAAGELALDAAVNSTVSAGATLETALEGAMAQGASVDAVAVANSVSRAYGAYNDLVRAQAMALAALGAGAAPSIEILILAEGAFRFR